jgi:hypothetical protein
MWCHAWCVRVEIWELSAAAWDIARAVRASQGWAAATPRGVGGGYWSTPGNRSPKWGVGGHADRGGPVKKQRMLPVVFALVAMLILSLPAAAATTTVIVTEDDVTRQAENTPPTDNWVLYTRVGTPPTSAVFVTGPGTPPVGVGSLQLTTATGAEKVYLFNYDYVETPLSAIDTISYSTYRTAGSAQQVTALNIQVDYNGPDVEGGFTTLVFEPVYNTDQGAVVNDQWQDWDAYNGGDGIWWSTRSISGVCAFDCFVTWDDIIAANPEATIVGGFGVNQGSGNPGLVASVDALTIGVDGTSTIYNFDPYQVATDKDQCKQGGWQTVTDADGNAFKNQGDCVSYVATGGEH